METVRGHCSDLGKKLGHWEGHGRAAGCDAGLGEEEGRGTALKYGLKY